MIAKALTAEFLGTFAWVFAACIGGMLAAPSGAGPVGMALAIGLTVMAMGQALAHVSGAHFNPAVTIGLIAGNRFSSNAAFGYVIAQVLGGLAAAALAQTIAAGALSAGPGATTRWNDIAAVASTFGGQRGFTMTVSLIVDATATALLVLAVMGTTSARGAAGAPLAIGAVVAALHLVTAPVTNAAFNPAQTTAVAVMSGGAPLAQLWAFWVGPIVGAILGGAIGRWLDET